MMKKTKEIDQSSQFFNDKEEIKTWLKTSNIQNYHINSSFVVDVDDDVLLNASNLSTIPVQFGVVSGDFDVSGNQLTSLFGCPQKVGGSFGCESNQLTSLEFCPKSVDKDFYCHQNLLTTLAHAPMRLKGDFYCFDNLLTSLEFCPVWVGKNFDFSNNAIESLMYFPKIVGDGVVLKNNPRLGDLQSQTSFKDLYAHHLNYVSALREEKLLKEKLSSVLQTKTQTHKI